MEASIFTKIVNGEIPAYKIAEDDRYLAFLDVFPTTKGHTLVIPKQQIDYLFDLDDDLYLGLMAFSKKVAAAVEKAVPCKRIGVAVVGIEVPHAHVHLIPLNSMQDMNFANKQKFSKKEFEAVAEKIREAYQAD
ncbi:HIT family protein [Pontibacter akesuensis]|uniref:Histidine triad (HIT) family protein n=1 Tax=Pontibacter akesuensis TaxID=388950 RepID=A0A1I7GIZ4_9BACT|nr:HIT family protein [Pontibacter akesuensis]GHA56544.1 hydrolase [Pontibacter akesuensis]SFU48404.1 histidine triad (HIT) family protein [Pontibacter akesuensis]